MIGTKQTESKEQTTILLVDDIAENLALLSECFEGAGMEIMAALTGEEALELVRYMSKPDIIMLDVMMPHMDGFETCRQLKAHPDTADIPIIFITALTDTESKVNSFAVGAVDYVCKPIQRDEVLARVNTHLRISRLQKQLVEKNKQLNQRNQLLHLFRNTAANELFPYLQQVSDTAKYLTGHNHVITPSEIYENASQIENASAKMIRVILDNLLNEDLFH
ncbi:response regulator containing a CheY-like receiver domain and an HD-GYP domain [Beggiatoa alba B18LD]|uniref:Response regulator containing a CheY-like receiver domain and an HD-GYP domain n=1 Tax=Beggiatoa alba B18LD TaxID=395493 RepID=I3CF78_9GAMM|nr:response regulator [Beggiatoa alba]EIJ42271.1 response regulator containing a CheY-like receiver domain and an HD-GYP domain [Beggiatoa alba B18LD]